MSRVPFDKHPRGASPRPRRSFLRMGLGALAGAPLIGCDLASPSPSPGDEFRAGAQSEVAVAKAKLGQAILGCGDRCSLSADLAGFALPGEQIRIYRSPEEFALYTVDELREQDPPGTIRLSHTGRQRLGTAATFPAVLDTQVLAAGYSDEEAAELGEFVERRGGDFHNRGVIALAPHGGRIEQGTDLQAELLAELRGVGYWCCKGWRNPSGAFDRWHVPSADISPASFPRLAELAGVGYARAVAFHGQAAPGVLVGGSAPLAEREIIAEAVAEALAGTGQSVSLAEAGDELGGGAPSNLVNWLCADGSGGIQLEQGPSVRLNHAEAVVGAVAAALAVL